MHPKQEILESGAVLLFDIRANAFLRHMVRNVVATLVMVGQGSLSPTDVMTILVRRTRPIRAASPSTWPVLDGSLLSQRSGDSV